MRTIKSGLNPDFGCRTCRASFMIRLNRTTEYALIALRHMSGKRRVDPDSVTSAREVADQFGLPFEITAKTLQRLRDSGLIQSAQGARGGYTLSFVADTLSLAEFMRKMEGPQSVVACAGLDTPLSQESSVSPAFSLPRTRKNAVGRPPLSKDAQGCGCEYRTHCGIQTVMSSLNAKVLRFLEGISMSEILNDSARVTLPHTPVAISSTTTNLSSDNQSWSDPR